MVSQVAQECGTLPVGFAEINAVHFARARLGYSTYVCYVWAKGRPGEWFIFVSRCVGKSAKLKCKQRDTLLTELRELGWIKPWGRVTFWADGGPNQR